MCHVIKLAFNCIFSKFRFFALAVLFTIVEALDPTSGQPVSLELASA